MQLRVNPEVSCYSLMKYGVKELCWHQTECPSGLGIKVTMAPVILHLHLFTRYEYETDVIPTLWDPFKE